MDSAEDFKLKNLLILWRCEVVYNLLKEEEIDLEDLKLIKYHHVNQLLQRYKMGVRIRFEYYLEKWRNSIGIPFTTELYPNHTHQIVCHCNQQSSNNRIAENQNIQAEVPTPTNISRVHNSQENIHNKKDSPVQRPLTLIKVVDTDTLIGCPISPSDSNEKRPSETPNLEMNTSEGIVNAKKKDSNSFRTHCPFSLAEILRRSGSKGSALIQYYQRHNEFTSGQRSLLIQLICNFFKEFNFHMSLQRSHELEKEILKMFPSENLPMYRNEKRGKLYIKFTNMKSYKRERQKAVKQRTVHNRSLDYEFGEQLNETSNMGAVSCDSWPETFDSDHLFVKTEEIY